MTREEAITDIRDNIKPIVGGKSLDMAIKALEQEPCEDAISRQAVLDAIDRYINKSQSTGTQDDFYSFAELVVKQLPPVNPQPKTGHWIMKGRMQNIKTCSVCGDIISHLVSDNYCPNCGAKMESEDKE